ncbi:MAG: SPOR domain-containing protein [Stellaceae bacterium]
MTKLQTELRPARYTVSSRDIDDEHRPRIVRFAAADPVYRPRPSPVASAVRRSTSGPLLFTAALAGVGIYFLMSSLLREPPEIASATALNSMPLRPAESLLVDHIVLEMPTAPAVIVSDHQRRGLASEWSNSTSSGTLDDQVAIAGATEIPATGGPQPVPGLGADSATGALQAPIAPNESPSADESAAKSRRSPVVAAAPGAAAPKASRRLRIVVQLSSYADQARARQAARTLESSLRSVLDGAHLQTERAEVHGKPVWRVVVDPVASRERGTRLCDAVHHAGRDCVVTLL